MVINFDKITSTIALFERTLVTPSRYDNFLHGDENALTKKEKIGLETFIDKGVQYAIRGLDWVEICNHLSFAPNINIEMWETLEEIVKS